MPPCDKPNALMHAHVRSVARCAAMLDCVCQERVLRGVSAAALRTLSKCLALQYPIHSILLGGRVLTLARLPFPLRRRAACAHPHPVSHRGKGRWRGRTRAGEHVTAHCVRPAAADGPAPTSQVRPACARSRGDHAGNRAASSVAACDGCLHVCRRYV